MGVREFGRGDSERGGRRVEETEEAYGSRVRREC